MYIGDGVCAQVKANEPWRMCANLELRRVIRRYVTIQILFSCYSSTHSFLWAYRKANEVTLAKESGA